MMNDDEANKMDFLNGLFYTWIDFENLEPKGIFIVHWLV